MAEYVMVYVGGNPPATPEEGQAHFAAYTQWLKDLGSSAVSPANPLMNTRTVEKGGAVSEGANTGISGYTVVEAASMEDAIEMAKGCPFLDIGGTLEVSERGHMPL